MPPTLHIAHVSEHPSRAELDGLGGLRLSGIRYLYPQFVTPSDPADPTRRARPHTEGIPRINGSSTWNGGTPWADGFDVGLFRRAVMDTAQRLYEMWFDPKTPHEGTVLNLETQWLEAFMGLEPRRLAEVSAVLVELAGEYMAVGPIPRHTWAPADKEGKLAWLRRFADRVPMLDLDVYLFKGVGKTGYSTVLNNTLEGVLAVGRAPSECLWRIMAHREGTDGKVLLTPAELRWVLAGIAGVGARRVLVWHNGDEWSKPGDPMFEASKRWAASAEIAAVFAEFTAPRGGGA
jgi:hypothetical protein